jgi:hypothetical protein
MFIEAKLGKNIKGLILYEDNLTLHFSSSKSLKFVIWVRKAIEFI